MWVKEIEGFAKRYVEITKIDLGVNCVSVICFSKTKTINA